jgi:YVTN family beta-propeller protein
MKHVLTAALLLSCILAIAVGARVAASTTSPQGLLFVANQFEHTTLLIDLSTRKTIFTAGVDINGHEVTISPDGRFGYVPVYGNSGVGKPGTDGSTIQVVDLQAGRTTDIIDLPKAVRPHSAKFAPDGLLYVTAELANALYVVDVRTHKVVAEIPTGKPEAHMLAISSDGKRAYTANVSSGSISVLDLQNRSLVKVIPVADKIQRLSLSPDGHHLYTHDQDKPRIAVIDASSNVVSGWIGLPTTVYSSAVTPDGRRLIANSASGKLLIVDLATQEVSQYYDIPPAVGAIAISADGSYAYITCPQAGTIEVINLRDNVVEKPIILTKGVDGIAWLPAQK